VGHERKKGDNGKGIPFVSFIGREMSEESNLSSAAQGRKREGKRGHSATRRTGEKKKNGIGAPPRTKLEGEKKSHKLCTFLSARKRKGVERKKKKTKMNVGGKRGQASRDLVLPRHDLAFQKANPYFYSTSSIGKEQEGGGRGEGKKGKKTLKKIRRKGGGREEKKDKRSVRSFRYLLALGGEHET